MKFVFQVGRWETANAIYPGNASEVEAIRVQ
jgi:hypothetical protein